MEAYFKGTHLSTDKYPVKTREISSQPKHGGSLDSGNNRLTKLVSGKIRN